MKAFLATFIAAAGLLLTGCDTGPGEPPQDPAPAAPNESSPDAHDVGHEVGETTREIGREAKQLGKEISQEAKEFSRGVKEGFNEDEPKK